MSYQSINKKENAMMRVLAYLRDCEEEKTATQMMIDLGIKKTSIKTYLAILMKYDFVDSKEGKEEQIGRRHVGRKENVYFYCG